MRVRGDNGETPFKPWQLTFLDDATRAVVGTALTAGRPTGNDVIAALASAVRGHAATDGRFLGGIPETVRWDNGGEFLNEAVTVACARLGIGPRPASAHSGHEKGKIERLHQTIQRELFSELPGASDGPTTYTGFQPWRGEDHQLLSFSALTLRTLAWIKSYNHDRVHSALTSTPFAAWRSDPHR